MKSQAYNSSICTSLIYFDMDHLGRVVFRLHASSRRAACRRSLRARGHCLGRGLHRVRRALHRGVPREARAADDLQGAAYVEPRKLFIPTYTDQPGLVYMSRDGSPKKMSGDGR